MSEALIQPKALNIIRLNMNILSSFTHSQVFQNLNDFVPSVEHKIIYFFQ